MSTEDGRVIFYSTSPSPDDKSVSSEESSQIPGFPAIGQIGGAKEGSESRVKDFEYLKISRGPNSPSLSLIVTGSSDGSIRVWTLNLSAQSEQTQLSDHAADHSKGVNVKHDGTNAWKTIPQAGQLIGIYETGNRITCLKAFVMVEAADEGDEPNMTNDKDGDDNGSKDILSEDSSE